MVDALICLTVWFTAGALVMYAYYRKWWSMKESNIAIAIDTSKAAHEYKRMLRGEIPFNANYLSELIEIHGEGKERKEIQSGVEAEFERPTCDGCGAFLVLVDCDCGEGCEHCFYDGCWLECQNCGGEMESA